MTRIAPLLLVLAALIAAGCGSSSDKKSSGSSQPAVPPNGAIIIKMKNIQFEPKSQTVKLGKAVAWQNEDDVDHNVVSTGGVSKFESDNFGKDGTFTFTPTKPGTIQYTCTLHPGMDATLTVVK